MIRTDRNTVLRGFTILELLLVIAIIGVLIALMVPAIGRARESARGLQTLSYLHGHGAVLAAYGMDWRDSFPAFFDPTATTHFIRLADGRVETYPAYFMSCLAWHIALLDSYYNRGPMIPFYPAEQTARFGVGGDPFYMSCSVFAQPAFWNRPTREGPSQWGPTRQTDVIYPSKKAVLVSAYYVTPGVSGRPVSSLSGVPTLAGDHSARRVRLGDYFPGVQDGEGPYPGALHFADFFAGLHTLDGVHGRDLR